MLEIAVAEVERAVITREAEMLERYQAGDEHALDELVATYQQPGFWVAYHLVRNHEVATDLVQEAFLKLLRRPEAYDLRRPFKAWFLRVVHNLAIDHLRRHRQYAVQEVVEVEGTEPEPDRVEQGELQAQVREILAALPEKYRRLILLRDVEGLEPMAMAEMEGIEPGTMRFRIHYARKAFKRLWNERFGREAAE